MKKLLFLWFMLGFSQLVLSQKKNITKSADGICIFQRTSPKMFKFVKTTEWKVTGDQLIDILSYQVSYYIIPYRGFINNKLFVDNYLDTLAYGYNSKGDNRTTKIYYCNCKLLFTDSAYNDKEKLLDERYDKNRHFNKEYNYLYKGNPIRFLNRGLLGTPAGARLWRVPVLSLKTYTFL